MKIEDGGAAFPITSPYNGRAGMSLRDWFAGQALAGLLADGTQRLVAKAFKDADKFFEFRDPLEKASIVNVQIALGAYGIADAMIAARKDTPA
jgi:5,10-methylenetetrahydrofolate reductase